MATLYDVDRAELGRLLGNEPSYRLDQVWSGLYDEHLAPADITTLPLGLRSRLEQTLPPALTLHTRSVADDGATIKYLWTLDDGAAIETVLMHYRERSTVCISTQAGCAMGCGFCATGQAGFDRQLSVGEIVEQVMRAARDAAPRRVSNVVFMGMGEPLANVDATLAVLDRLTADIGLSARHLTVSTVGVVPGIDRLTAHDLPVTLAVSLHAANDRLRDELAPINRRYPLAALEAACARWQAGRNRRLTFEWALIEDRNDRPEDARELAAIARRRRAHVNLIPLNRTDGFATRGTDREGVQAFATTLRSKGVNVTVRANRGNEIDAACGQLRAREGTRPVRVSGEAARARSGDRRSE